MPVQGPEKKMRVGVVMAVCLQFPARVTVDALRQTGQIVDMHHRPLTQGRYRDA